MFAAQQTVVLGHSLAQYEWSQFQGDSSFTRFSAGPAPDTSNILWTSKIEGIQPYISAFNGMIYLCNAHAVFAVDGQTGNIKWTTPIDMPNTWPAVYKIDNAHLIVENVCLDPQTGHVLWISDSFNADTGGIFNANVYSPEEKMFYRKVNAYVEAWDFSDPSKPPTRAWIAYVYGGGTTGSGITYGEGKVFPGSFENHQMALNAKTGTILWDTPTTGPMIFSGSYSQGRFVRGGTDDNTLYCFNATNGDILWTYNPGTDGYFTVGTAVGYGTVYALNKDGCLYAVDIETGNLTWSYPGPGPMLFPGTPTVADGKVYATTGQDAQFLDQVGGSEFACLDALTGSVLWKLSTEALAPRESVAVAYGNLYMIPGNVTTAVDTISGSEYATSDEIWAIGTPTIPTHDWPMWRADPSHSSSAPTGPTTLALNWKFQTQGAVSSSPSVVDGIVYVGSQDKNIYAIGAWSGNLLWKFPTQAPVESSPAIADGKLYTGGDDGYVYCLDAYTGVCIWKTFVNGNLPATFGSIVLKSSPVLSENTLYIGSLDGYLYALNKANGNIIWKTPADGRIVSSPALAEGAVFFTAEEPTTGALYKLNAATGALLWRVEIPYEFQFTGGTDMLGSPSVAAGLVFASSSLGAYYAFNATTGAVEWTFKNPYATEFIVSSPIYVDGKVFLIDKFDIACVDATNGHTLWSYFTGDELYVSPSYADGKIYVVTSQRHIYILDATNNGAELASVTTPSSSWSSPTLANGKLYIGCNDWNIYCFGENTTTPTQPLPPPTSLLMSAPLMFVTIIAAAVLIVIIALVSIIRKQNRHR
ncbi:MAG: PQQ-binding-like beta-propeller repeat protein [Candidatus Bathyarchaeota archaeon]|nr:PQQ-binding-like beta-propeller repeat protein [Candidatus Termitimicrobium sp.]